MEILLLEAGGPDLQVRGKREYSEPRSTVAETKQRCLPTK